MKEIDALDKVIEFIEMKLEACGSFKDGPEGAALELHFSECGELYWALYGWDCDCILIMNPDIMET